MADVKRPAEVRIRDPLSDVTRAERKTLLGVSAIGIIIAKSGLVPTKISALGVDFDRTDQAAILRMLSVVAVYFLVAFIVYATSDLIAWRVSFNDAVLEWRRSRELQLKDNEKDSELEERLTRIFQRGRLWSSATRPMSVVRAVFEFAIPIVVGAYAVVALASAPLPKPGPVAPTASSSVTSLPSAGSVSPQRNTEPSSSPPK